MKTSPSLAEFEFRLLKEFELISATMERDIRDAMHFVIFSRKDRIGAATAWELAPKLGISPEDFAKPAVMLEMIRCSTAFLGGKFSQTARPRNEKNRSSMLSSVEPELSYTAAYALVPLALSILRNTSQVALTEIWGIALEASSPTEWLSSVYRQIQINRQGQVSDIGLPELKRLQLQAHTPALRAFGNVLETLSGKFTGGSRGILGDWFQKLGLFDLWVSEFNEPATSSAVSLLEVLSKSEAIDVLKSLEAELLKLSATVETTARENSGSTLSLAPDYVDRVAQRLNFQWQ